MNPKGLFLGPPSFGKLNSILYIDGLSIDHSVIHHEICELFIPYEINSSLFHPVTHEIVFDVSPLIYPEYKNFIHKNIYNQKGERLILEQFENSIMITHLIDIKIKKYYRGLRLIKKYFTHINAELVIGFELSLSIKDFYTSLNESIADISLHPFVRCKFEKKQLKMDSYLSEYNAVSAPKITYIQNYLKVMSGQ